MALSWVEVFSNTPHAEWLSGSIGINVLRITFVLVAAFLIFDSVFRGFLVVLVVVGLCKGFAALMSGHNPSIWIFVFAFSLVWSAWSLFTLGFRKSFLYARIDDKLETSGPYKYFRHPQLVSALALCLSSIFTVIPNPAEFRGADEYRLIVFWMMAVFIVVITRIEEKDLAARFGEEWLAYKKTVPSLLAFRRAGRGSVLAKGAFWGVNALVAAVLFVASGEYLRLAPARSGVPLFLGIAIEDPG
ncbi:MAG: hypothetical protein HY897_21650 [Deltaproteobacteria bacterium]|nr:hypothetical protein [Deltaproteobacteria bacterium]